MNITSTGEFAAPAYTVDERGKVVGGYRPPGASNWGRWGEDDQRGAANLIGPEQVAAAARLVTRGAVFSLSLPIDPGSPRFPTRPPSKHSLARTGADAVVHTLSGAPLEGLAYNDDEIDMYTHGATHWDAMSHVQVDDTFFNGFWSGAVTATHGARVLGIEHMRSSFVGRGVLLDVARHREVDSLEAGEVIEASELDAVAAAQGVELRAGDMVVLRTGFMQRWWQLENDLERAAYFGGAPGIGVSSIPWVADHDIAAIAADTVSVEVMPCEDELYPVHKRLLVDLGVTIGEFFVLEELADDCAADGVYEFFLAAQPLHLPHAVGSPLNPIAVK
jgi:kynurenine formamidase